MRCSVTLRMEACASRAKNGAHATNTYGATSRSHAFCGTSLNADTGSETAIRAKVAMEARSSGVRSRYAGVPARLGTRTSTAPNAIPSAMR